MDTNPNLLWERTFKADDVAFRELHSELLPRLWSLYRKHGCSESEIEDLIQQTWLRAFKSCNTFDSGKGTFLTWIFTIAIRVLFNARRSDRRKPKPNQLPIEGLEGTSPLPQDWLFALERSERLSGCLQELGKKERQIISMRFWEGLQFKEIEERLELSARDVKNAYWRGIRQLPNCMRLFEKENS